MSSLIEPWGFAGRGRIGRLRALVYSMVVFLFVLPVIAASMALILNNHEVVGTLLSVAITIVVGIVDAMFSIRRLHDMNASGWWALFNIPMTLMNPKGITSLHLTGVALAVVVLIYIAVFIYCLVLMFAPGTLGDNRFGSAPPPNSGWIVGGSITAIILPFAACTAIFAVVTTMRGAVVHHTEVNNAPAPGVTVQSIPSIVEKLSGTQADGNFVVFMFVPSDNPDSPPINIQWSIEDGRVGLDWVLLSPRNVADEDMVKSFAEREGYKFSEHEMNNVHYLRVEGPGTTILGVDILEKLYDLTPESQLEVTAQGVAVP